MFDLDTRCSMTKSHKILSLLFHPLLTCTWAALIDLCSPLGKVLLTLLHPSAFWILLAIVLGSTFAAPVLVIAGVSAAIRKKEASGTLINTVTLTFSASILFMIIGYYMLKDIALALPLNLYLLSAIGTCIIAMMTKSFWNISYYAITWGNLSGLLFYLCLSMPQTYLIPFLGIILLSGVAGWNRLATQAHRHAEVYAGYVVGFAATATLFTTLL